MKHDQMVLERTPTSSIEPSTAGSAIKTILFHVHGDAALDTRLEAALSVARRFGAHLQLLHVTPTDAFTVVDAFGTFTNLQIVEALQADAAKLRARLEEKLGGEDVTWDYEEVAGSLMPRLVQCASLADLLVIGRESKSPEFEARTTSLLGAILHQARTPLLVLGDQVHGMRPSGPAVVAWNESLEAANAVRASVPLLAAASDVILLNIEESTGMQIPAKRVRAYLSRHGVESRLQSRPPMGDSIADDILDGALAEGATCVIMGGYSHNRMGEYLFGGVTRTLLKACPIPLVVAH
jgi:nucleotide-binding universal stress UspA family protein